MPRHVDDDTTALARRCWGVLEPIHVLGYFAPEPAAAYAAIGLEGRAAYFPARAACMGPVGVAPVVAAFYVFAPRAVGAALPDAWSVTSPAAMVAARREGVAAALHRVLGEPDVSEALDLVRTVCAGLTPQGRGLYAAHSTLPEPTEPLLALWHGATLVREHRGDGHVNALLHAGIGPVEALALSGPATGSTEFVERTRGWTPDEWTAAREGLAADGLLARAGDGWDLTDEGGAVVAALERQTDRAAVEGWAHLGRAGCERLIELVQPLRDAVVAAPEMPTWIASRGT